jgi:ABC-2 type transport system permease protein
MSGRDTTGHDANRGETAGRAAPPRDAIRANAWIVARREFGERVRSRIFYASSGLLAVLAIAVALTPTLVKLVDRGSTTTIAVASADAALTSNTIRIIGGLLNPQTAPGQAPAYTLRPGDPSHVSKEVGSGQLDGALIAARQSNGQLSFQLLTGERLGADKVQLIQVGAVAVGIADWIDRSRGAPTTTPFFAPTFDPTAVAGGSGKPVAASEYAARRIVGVVFVVLIFITLVIYGMWVAAGVVAEKTSRVMELLISAASPAQLVLGKVIGIGLAGFLQYVTILVPALLTLLFEDRIAATLLGTSSDLGLSLGVLSPSLLAAYGGFWVLGFILYSLIYAAAGSLVSRAEDLQVLALPLSLIAIVGYIVAVMALSGGIGPITRVASYIPFWSPFVMLTRLTIGTVEPWEMVLAYGLLLASIPIVAIIAVRVYSAGVLLYGQRPGARAIVGAIVNPPA